MGEGVLSVGRDSGSLGWVDYDAQSVRVAFILNGQEALLHWRLEGVSVWPNVQMPLVTPRRQDPLEVE